MQSETIKNRIKKPFVFLSYSQDNLSEATILNNHLLDAGINTVFDGGGLEGGANLRWYEQLVMDPNCYCVLIVFDNTCINKIKNETGGVWNEYRYTCDRLHSDPSMKCIPILSKGIKKTSLPTPFNSVDVYDRIENWAAIVEDCRLDKGAVTISLAEAEYNFNLACRLYEEGDYIPSKETLTMLIERVVKRKNSVSIRAKAYSMLLDMYIKGVIDYDDSVREAHNRLLSLVEKSPIRNDKTLLPRYLLNCSKTFTINNEHVKAIEYADRALSKAREFGCHNLYHYENALSTAFAEYRAYNSARDYIVYAVFILIKDYQGCNESDIASSIEVYFTYSEVMIAIANKVYDKDSLTACEIATGYLALAKEKISFLESRFSNIDFNKESLQKLEGIKQKYQKVSERIINH